MIIAVLAVVTVGKVNFTVKTLGYKAKYPLANSLSFAWVIREIEALNVLLDRYI